MSEQILNAISVIALQIHQSVALEEIFQNAVTVIRGTLYTDRGIICRSQPDGSGEVSFESVGAGWTPMLGQMISAPCFNALGIDRERQEPDNTISDLADRDINPGWAAFVTQFQGQAPLAVPIIAQGDRWGWLMVHHCQCQRSWQSVEVQFLQQMAVQLGIALYQAALHQQLDQGHSTSTASAENTLRQRAEKEQALNQVVRAISQSLDLNIIFSTATTEIAQLLQVDRTTIEQYLPERRCWQVIAEYRQHPDLPMTLGLEIPDEENPITVQLKQVKRVNVRGCFKRFFGSDFMLTASP
ncbi:hypothetical protein DO97_05510 [Neosynechococcus sphagnicola sy1]|uniref:Phytochrome chromophore attachment site domain-containing protein n=1 Tax=Neosynechococcus sphagnicola sy1 TaxID=1497020 RepID=A0A098TKH2_9CYAN|nr:GAF domain-containing protein [Neosynechococcus sphagnicola]KGF72776.1 hypothetical protein DO97_05510 [Neosynechococcus sphagnicola sy1]